MNISVNKRDVNLNCSVQYTEQEGRSLGLSGWVQNTRRGTVIGQIQGAAGQVDHMSVTL